MSQPVIPYRIKVIHFRLFNSFVNNYYKRVSSLKCPFSLHCMSDVLHRAIIVMLVFLDADTSLMPFTFNNCL